MATRAFIPLTVAFGDRSIIDAYVLTLHGEDGRFTSGSLTVADPPKAGERGVLRCRGTQDGQSWDVTLDGVEIVNATAVGCEFRVGGTASIAPAAGESATAG